MTWLAAILPGIVAVALLLVPGGILGYALGLRRLTLVSMAAPLSVSLVAVASIVAPVVHLTWGILPVAVLTIVAAVVVWALRRFALRRPPVPDAHLSRRQIAAIVVGVLLAAAAVTGRLMLASRDAADFAATFDNAFHLDAIRYILDTGNASSFWINGMVQRSGPVTFYPGAWHAFNALVIQLSGAPLTVSVNAVTAVVAGLVWPLGMVALTSELFGRRPALLVSAGVLSAAFAGFPLQLVAWGSLYPLLFALALLPPLLRLTWRLVRRIERRHLGEVPVLIAALVLGAPGLAIAHPSAAVLWFSFGALMVASELLVAAIGSHGRRRLAFAGGVVALVVIWLGVLQLIRPPADQLVWHARETLGQAIGEAITLSVNHGRTPVVLALLVIVGVVIAAIRRTRTDWFVLWLWVLVSALFVVAAGVASETIRAILTGSWYTDVYRLAAFLAFAAIPLGALGAARVWTQIDGGLRGRLPRVARRIVGVVVVLLLAAGSQATMSNGDLSRVFVRDASSDAVTPDEFALIQRLPAEVPHDAKVVGDPWMGTTFAYAVVGVDVWPKHLFFNASPDEELILRGLSTARPGDAVCRAVAATGTGYVLSFEGREIADSHHAGDYPGLLGLDASPAVTLVDQQGTARLYRITGC
jgi:hypothetical protein